MKTNLTATKEQKQKKEKRRSARISFFWGPPVYGSILRGLEVMLDGAPLGKIRMICALGNFASSRGRIRCTYGSRSSAAPS